jgi:pantetheine-phosphate adenylyltransferase
MSPTVPTETAGTAILFATIKDLDTPYILAPVVHTAATLTKHKLIIVLFSRFFNVKHEGLTFPETLAISHTARSSWNDVQKLLTYVYVQATKAAQEMGKVLMDIDILLKGLNDDHLEADLESLVSDLGVEVVFRISGGNQKHPTLMQLRV